MTCRAVAKASAVSVLVIDCTTTALGPPTLTPPTLTATEFLRLILAMKLSGSFRIGFKRILSINRQAIFQPSTKKSRIEDRGSRIEDRGAARKAILDLRSSILDLRSSSSLQ